MSLWNEYGAVLREGDILRLNGCFTQIWKNSLQVKVGNKGQIIKVGEFMMIFNEVPDMSILSPEILKEIQDQQQGAQSAGGVGGSVGLKQHQPLSLSTSTSSSSSPLASPTNQGGMHSYGSNNKSGPSK